MLTTRGIRRLVAGLTAVAAVTSVRADYTDCRTCHYAVSPENTAPDFTRYFVEPGHHPVRVSYPVTREYNQPISTLSGILFFDLNGNGIPDPEEIQIFSSNLTTPTVTTTATTATRSKAIKKTTTTTTATVVETWMIDCASCHAEHGSAPSDPLHPADYLRTAGGDRLLCLTCHRL